MEPDWTQLSVGIAAVAGIVLIARDLVARKSNNGNGLGKVIEANTQAVQTVVKVLTDIRGDQREFGAQMDEVVAFVRR